MSFLRTLLISQIFFIVTKAECRTGVNEVGLCVPIEQCFIVMDIFENAPKPFSDRVLNYLRKCHCGSFEGKHYVCCASRHIQEVPSTSSKPIHELGTTTTTEKPKENLLPTRECGKMSQDKVSRGSETSLGEFPWMALLQYKTDAGLKFRCGGTLISQRYVLTAAHCIEDDLVSVRVGEHDTTTIEDCEGPKFDIYCLPPHQDIPIEKTIKHPDFIYVNDIALIRLSIEVNTQLEHISPICLPLTNEQQNYHPSKVILAGWGKTEKGTFSNVLVKAIKPIKFNEECQRIYGRKTKIEPSQICAGGENGIDSCIGDSGGPLFYAGGKTVRYFQYGIVSFGFHLTCGNEIVYPGVYTRVSHFIDWIISHMEP